MDFAVISHFHYDHAGGLEAFLALNKMAEVYIGKEAFENYYVMREDKMEYFGMDKSRFDLGRFVFVDREHEATGHIKIVSKLGYNFNNPLNDKCL